MILTGTFQSVPFENGKLQTITGCSGYEKYSIAELRSFDYSANKRVCKIDRYTWGSSKAIKEKPMLLSRKKPMMTKIVEKMTRYDPMDIDTPQKFRSTNWNGISTSMDDIKGRGFKDTTPITVNTVQSMNNLSSLLQKGTIGENRDQLRELPFISTPNLSNDIVLLNKRKSIATRIVVHKKSDSLEEKKIFAVPVRNNSIFRPELPQLDIKESPLPDSAKIFTEKRESSTISRESRPNSLYSAQYHSMSSLQDVLQRNQAPNTLTYGRQQPARLASMGDSNEKIVAASEPQLERESMLEDMNKELFNQLKTMRLEMQHLKTENKRLTMRVERLSKNLDSLGRPENVE